MRMYTWSEVDRGGGGGGGWKRVFLSLPSVCIFVYLFIHFATRFVYTLLYVYIVS